MRFLNLGLEEETPNPEEVDLDPNETGQAKEVVENQDSTEPAKVLQMANYKEELATLRAQNPDDSEEIENDDDSDGGDDSDSSDDGDDDGGTEDVSSETDGDSEDEDGGDESGKEGDDDGETTNDVPEKTDSEVAQETFFTQGLKMCLEALDSTQEMAKYHRLLAKRSKLGGISHHTAKVITCALEVNAQRCGYIVNKHSLPALESYDTYSGSANSTRELSVAVEGFLSDTWEAIKKFFKSILTWITDLLSGKKKGPTDAVSNPQNKSERDKSIDVLKNNINTMNKKLLDIEKLRVKDEASGKPTTVKEERKQLPKNIAKVVFKNNDKGNVKEALTNLFSLTAVIVAFQNMVKPMSENSTNFITEINAGKDGELSNYIVEKGSLIKDNFEVLTSLDGNLVTGQTSELFGGTSAVFTYVGNKAALLNDPKKFSYLSKQGLKFVKLPDEQDQILVEPLTREVVKHFQDILMEIEKCFTLITSLQGYFSKMAGVIEKVTKSQDPQAWVGLDQPRINQLKEQVVFIGAISGSMGISYKNLEAQVNSCKNGISNYTQFYIK